MSSVVFNSIEQHDMRALHTLRAGVCLLATQAAKEVVQLDPLIQMRYPEI